MSATTTPKFEILRSKHEFETCEQDWNALFEKAGRGPHLFQTYNWLWHWLQLRGDANLCLLTGRLEGELVLIAPLVLEKTSGLKIVKWAGEPVSQYGDILIKNHIDNLQWLKQGFNYLKETLSPDLFHLRKTRFDASIHPLLENYNATILEEMVAPYIEILGAKTFTEFNKRYSQRSRKSKRRHRRKLEEKGTLNFQLYKEGEQAHQAANLAIKLKRQWLEAQNIISPAFRDDFLDRFFASTSKDNNHPCGLRLSELSLDDQPVALEIGIVNKNYYGAHLGVYDRQYIAHSPGTLQMQDTIAELIKKKIDIIDLFAPGDKYKFEWTDQSVPVYDFAFSLTLKGKLYEQAYLKALRPKLKQAITKISDIKQTLKKKSPT